MLSRVLRHRIGTWGLVGGSVAVVFAIACGTNQLALKRNAPKQERAEKMAIVADRAQNIHGGVTSSDTAIGAFVVNTATGRKVDCSGVVIKDRCVLTARHCTEAGSFHTQDVVDPATSYGARYLRDIDISGAADEWRDLRVVWMTKKKCPPTGYCASATESDQSWGTPVTLASTVPNVDDLMALRGYGHNLPGTSPSPTPVGIGTRRDAGMQVTSAGTNSFGYPGSVIVHTSLAGGSGNTCVGDDGGGTFADDGKLMGIISTVDSNCDGVFNAKATGFAGGNYDWVKDQIDNFCVPKMMVTVTITPSESMGHVESTAPGSQGSQIACGEGQTKCISDFLPNSFTLVATPASGKAFDKWTEASTGTCPCNNSTNTTCNVSVNFGGNDTPGDYFESAICIAKFKNASPVPTP